MITAHSGRATDFTGLGLGTLQPIQSEIREEAGGEYELELTQPVTEAMLHAPLMKHNIIKAPAPVREVPLSALVTPGTVTVTREIYRVITIKRLSLRSEPNDTTSYNIKCYDPGTLVAKISDEGQQGNHKWYRVQILDGGQVGYMAWQAQYDGVWYDYLTLDHTETETIQGDAPGTVVTPKQDREQLFRIYNVRRSSAEKTVTARAQHIFYDLKGVIVDGEFKPDGMAANQAVARILQMADREHPFHIYCQCTGEITADYSGRNLADCLLNPDDGILKQTGGRLLRDNFDVYILEDEVRMPGLELRRGCNLLQATLEEDAADIVTRIIPVGEDADGNPLRGDAVDSEHIDDYPIVYTKEIKYPVRVRENQNGGEGGTSSGDYPTEAEALEALQEKAEEDFASGIDLPTVSIDAEYVRRELAPEFADAANQLALHMYDAAPVIDPETGLQAALRMTSYTWDCLMERYTETGLGEIQSLTPTVYGYQIGGSISGTKLLAGTVGGGALRDAAIGYAKIGTAAITQLAADAVTAIRAEVRSLVAGQITTDQLYADLAEIAVAQITTAHIQAGNIQWANITELTARIAAVAVAQITTANIQAANIQWANISELTSRIATLAAAQITTANIQAAGIQWADISELNTQIASVANAQIADADIGYAKIKDLTAGTAIITEGVGGQLYIARLAVTDANMVTLTAGELLLKAADGSFVRLIADGQGGVTTQTVQVEGSNIASATIPGGKLVEGTITARELNVSAIFADQALIGAIKAANIDVANLFAAQATIDQLNALDIRGNEYLRLLVSDSIGDISVGGRNLMTNTAAYPKGNNADKAELTGETYQDCAVRYYENTAGSGEAIYIRRAHTLAKSSQYVLSMWVKGSGTISIRTQEANPVDFTASNGEAAAGHVGVSFTLSDRWDRIWVRIATRAWNMIETAGKTFTVRITAGSAAYSAGWKLENGNMATDWCPAPEDVEGAIAENTAEIALTNQQVALRATQADLNAMGSRVTAAEAALTVQAGEIAARITKTEFWEKVTDGRNMLLESEDQYSIKKSIHTYLLSEYGKDRFAGGAMTVTISFDARASNATNIDAYPRTATTGVSTYAKVVSVSTEWARYSVTYVFPEAAEYVSFTIRSNSSVPGGSVTATVYVRNVKLETGALATEWSPAPEETDAEISGLDTRVTSAEAKITDSAIVTTVRGSTAYQNDLTTVEQTANAYAITVAGGVQVGGTNMFPNTKPMKLGNYTIDASGASAQGTVTEQDGGLKIVNSGSNVRIWLGNRFPMIGGQSYAVSFRYKVNTGTLDAPDILFRCRDANDDFTYKSSADGAVTVTDMESGWKKFAVVFAPPAGTVSVDAAFRTGADYALYTNNFLIKEFKLETGTRATAWSPAPEDAAKSLDTGNSGVKVKISSADFSVDVPGTSGDLRLDSSGGHLQKAIIDELDCPNAARVYTGTGSITVGKSTSTYLSLQEAFSALNGSVVSKVITITLEADLYEQVDLAGVSGAAGSGITINGGGYTLYGRMTIRYMQPRVVLNAFKLVGDTASSYPLLINGCPFVYLTDCTIDASGCAGADTQAVYTYASTLRMDRVAMYNATHLLNCEYLSHVLTYNLKGGNCTNFLRALASVVHMVGTRPSGSYSGGWGMMVKPDDPTALTVDSGGTQPPVIPTTTSTLACTASGHYWNGWESGNSILQGSYDNATYAGCMWFDTSAISGKTIRSATLTVRRLNGYGTWDTTKLYLCGTTLTGKSGNPITGSTSYGSIGSLAENASGTFAIPAQAIQDIANGTTKGLMLYISGDAHNRGSIYSDNFSAYAGYGASGAPSLSVTYDT